MNLKIYRYLTISAAAIFAASLSTEALTFDEAVQTLLSNNPALQQAEASRTAAVEQMRSENNLEDPEVSFQRVWGREEADHKWEAGISQSFDWPGAYGARSRAIEAGDAALRWATDKERVDAAVEARLLLAELLTAKKRVDLYQEIDTAYHVLAVKYRTAFEKGECTILDVNKVKIESASYCTSLSEAQLKLRQIIAQLSTFAGGLPCDGLASSLGSVPLMPIESEEYYAEQIRSLDPAVLQAESEQRASRLRLKAAKMEAFPSFSLGYVHQYEDYTHFNGFNASMTLPIFSNRHKSAAARAELLQSEIGFNAAEIEALNTMRIDREEALRLTADCKLYSEALSSDNFRLLKLAFEGGEINLLTFIQEISYFLEATDKFLDLDLQRQQALIRLNRLSSTSSPQQL